MGLKSKKSYLGKGKGFHGHEHEHSINATEGWDKRYKDQYGKPLSKKKAKLIHGLRPAKNQRIDNSKQAQTILKPGTYRANAYIKNPNRYDIEDVDTISIKSKTKTHAKKEQKEFIKGGLADNQPYSKYDKKQLEMGIKVEMEHTNDPKIAKEIASDHLEEIPDYYTRLHEMEEKAEKDAKQPKTRITYKVKIDDWEFYYDSEYLAKNEAKRLEKIHNSKANVIKTRSPTYSLGDLWRDDFDYIGMLKTGTKVDCTWSNTELNKLYDSYEDVNYHTPNELLWKSLNAKNDNDRKRLLSQFNSASQKKIDELSIENKSPTQLDFVAEGTHSKKEVEEIFREESKKVWANDSLIDDTLVQTAKHQYLHINKDAMKLSESDFRKLMRHESLHLGYAGHSQDFRRLAKSKDISVTERQLFKEDILIQVKSKDQYRYKTIKKMKSEDEAHAWLKENRKSLTKKGVTKTRLVI